MNNRLRQAGFTLVEVMVTLGIFGIFLIGFINYTVRVDSDQKKYTKKYAQLELWGSMGGQILDPEACTYTFKDHYVGLELPAIKDRNNAVYLYVNQALPFNKDLRVSSMKTQKRNEHDDETFSIELIVTVEDLKNMKTENLKIPVTVLVENGKVVNCITEENSQESDRCRAMGGIMRESKCRLPRCAGDEYLQIVKLKEDEEPAKKPVYSGIRVNLRDVQRTGAESKRPLESEAVCVKITCPEGKFFKGIDEKRNSICSDPVSPASCGVGQYVKGITPSGALNCQPLPNR